MAVCRKVLELLLQVAKGPGAVNAAGLFSIPLQVSFLFPCVTAADLLSVFLLVPNTL